MPENTTYSGRLLEVCELLFAFYPKFNLNQLRLLLFVQKHQPISQVDLGSKSNLDAATISRFVDVFSASGRRDKISTALNLLKTQSDPNDDRVKLIQLTSEGNELLSMIANHV